MKIGDRVRFLNAVGGGTVKRFKNKNIVIVEEDDGFETPVLIRECIVVGQENAVAAPAPVKPAPAVDAMPEREEYEIVEISGGDRLNVWLAFLPTDIKQLGKCNYEAYLINESNYYLFFDYMSRTGGAWTSRMTDTIEPNTQLFIEEFAREDINALETVCVQAVAFKRDKPFSLKNPFSVEIRIDGVKFYKLHCFRENEFFDEEALIYPVVVNDSPHREMLISASDLQEAMTEKAVSISDARKRKSSKPNQQPEIIEVDLHIKQLLETTAGMSAKDMLDYQLDVFRRTMEENRSRRGQRIVFIHGKGDGVLKSAIMSELRSKYGRCDVQDASFKEYGFGATMVRVRG